MTVADSPERRFLSGGWQESGRSYTVTSPATGEALAEVADCGAVEGRAANDTPYGLAAYIYISDLSRAFRVSEALE